MDDKVEDKTNAHDCTDSSGCSVDDLQLPARTDNTCPSTLSPVVIDLIVQGIPTAILSIGISAALVIFVIESFRNPTAATVVIPLIVGTGCPFFVQKIREWKNAKQSNNRLIK